MHLFYLLPQPLASGAKAIKLQLRALDGKDFRQKNPLAHLRNAIPRAGLGSEAGHLQLLLGLGTDLNAETQLWDIRSLVDTRLSAANGWDSLSSTGQPIIGLTPDPTASQPLFLSFFDPTRGGLSWAAPDGSLQQQDQFTYSSPENGIAGLIGAFAVPGEGHVWFLETRFDIVAFHLSAPGGAPEAQVLPIEGSSSAPEPGVYIDSTLVRGNRVSVALWNDRKSRFEKPLRYSLEIPAGCVEMAPAYLDSRVESFSLPLLCGQGGQTQLRVAVP
jgi:hypothetical protein